MATIFLRHPVADYKTWRPIYDGDRSRREKAGLRERGVYQHAKNPNDVLIMWSADSVDGFNAMVGSKGLEEKMKEAGVTGAPEFWVAK